jgi:hypothetical protein
LVKENTENKDALFIEIEGVLDFCVFPLTNNYFKYINILGIKLTL